MLLPRRMRWEILHFAAFFASPQFHQFSVILCKCICILRVLPISPSLCHSLQGYLHSLRLANLRHSLQVYLLFCILYVSPISCRIDQSLQVYLLLLQIQPPRIALSVRLCHSDIISLPLINFATHIKYSNNVM